MSNKKKKISLKQLQGWYEKPKIPETLSAYKHNALLQD